jgi:hypothetical protein
MSNIYNILEKLPAYRNEQTMIAKRQDTYDIIREILKTHADCCRYYDKIAHDHWAGDAETTAKELFAFMKKNFPYKEEGSLMQTAKEPQAIIAERLEYGSDCKHYASYIVGVLEALARAGYPVKSFYRFASYDPNKKAPGHVFAVMVTDAGNEIWIDPVPAIGGFNSRRIIPFHKTDKMPPMSENGNSINGLYRISGISNQATVGNRHRYGQHPAHITRNIHRHYLDEMPTMQGISNLATVGKHGKGKAKFKKFFKSINPGNLVLKFGLGPSRAAFQALTQLNTFNLAVRMWKTAAHDRNSAAWHKLSDWWKKHGGNPDSLYKSIKRGVNTHNKLHKKHKVSGYDVFSPNYVTGYEETINGYRDPESDHIQGCEDCDHMGFAPVAAAGLIAAAAPIIAAVSNILKAFGDKGHNQDEVQEAVNQDTNALAQQHNEHTDEHTDDNGTTTHTNGTQATVTEEGGQQVMHVKHLPTGNDGDNNNTTPATTPATGGDGGGDGGEDQAPAHGGGFSQWMQNTGNFIKEHKTAFIIGGSVLVVGIVFLSLYKHKKGGRK